MPNEPWPDKRFPLDEPQDVGQCLDPGAELLRLGWARLESAERVQAEACFLQGVELSPSDARLHFALGKTYQDMGRLAEALTCYARAAQLDPGCAPAHYNKGLILMQTGRHEDAVEAFQLAVRSDSGIPPAYNNLGIALQELGRGAEALGAFEQAVEMDPGYAQAHCNAGRLLFGAERWEEARARFQQAAASDPGHAAAWHGLGLCFQKMRDLDSAGRCYEKALALKPDYHAAAIDMGNVCLDRGDFCGMADWYRRALDFTSADAADFLNVGRMYQDQGRLDDALECIEAALGRDPESVAAHFNRAAILLAQGEWTQGWKEYEWRFRHPDRQNAYPHRLPAPRWDGRSFGGRTLLVHCEQGLGDSIQFARYLPLVKDRGGTVLFEMPAALKPLFENLPGMDEALVFSPAAMTTRRFDLQVPLLSLPGIFNATVEDLPGAVPYLKADPGRTAAWAPRLSAGRLKVGIVWAASGWNQALARKSCRLSDFLPLAALPGVRLYGMQKGPAASEAAEIPDGIAFANLGEQFADFADTAAVIANLDLVISVDTAVAHLAGAMGKPVWVLLPFCSDWRWLLNRDDSPWYPTMRLFRQPKRGDWQEVFMQVSDRLIRRIGLR